MGFKNFIIFQKLKLANSNQMNKPQNVLSNNQVPINNNNSNNFLQDNLDLFSFEALSKHNSVGMPTQTLPNIGNTLSSDLWQ